MKKTSWQPTRPTLTNPLDPGNNSGQDWCPNACTSYDTQISSSPALHSDFYQYLNGLASGAITPVQGDLLDAATPVLRANGYRRKICHGYDDVAKTIANYYNTQPSVAEVQFQPGSHPAGDGKLDYQAEWDNAMSFESRVACSYPGCERKPVFNRMACGCFADDTTIQLASGQLMPISEIKGGDLVWNPKTLRAYHVTEVTAGPELIPMIEIKTAEKRVLVTVEHPLLTKQGLKTAEDLEKGDILMDGQKTATVISVDKKAPDLTNPPIVWNLVLDGPNLEDHYVNANELMAGDLYLQRLLKEKKQGCG
ncbi:MAG: hypothetical protein H7249_01490 [Chitinophagaceae bacterium]|nr:hypothetical protein [Oligoflexus sp.]